MGDLGVRERLVLTFAIWLAVYPSVLCATWVVDEVGMSPPLPVKVLITTAFTVPLLEFAVIPLIRRLIARAERAADIDGGLRED